MKGQGSRGRNCHGCRCSNKVRQEDSVLRLHALTLEGKTEFCKATEIGTG